MKKGIAIIFYVLLMAAFFGFDLSKLFDIRQMLLVFLGSVILYLPNVFDGKASDKRDRFDSNLFGQNALWASLIEFFILFFYLLSGKKSLQYLSPELALACRPVLYGFCIWLIFHKEQEEGAVVQKSNSTEEEPEVLSEPEGNADDQSRQPEAGKESTESISEKLEAFGLTRREVEVARLILKGMSNAEIAAELYISETTVKKHISNIFQKVGIRARGELKTKL